MKKIIFFIIGIFLNYTASYGNQIKEQHPVVTWYIFPNAVRVIDSNTIWIVANGMTKEIKLYDICSTKIERKDAISKNFIENLLLDKRVEIKIYGQNYQQQDLGILFVDGININNKVAAANYVLSGNQCLSTQIARRERNTTYKTIDGSKSVRKYEVKRSGSLSKSRGTSSYRYKPSSSTGRPKTVHVKGYHRKDGTYVRPHMRSAPR